MSNSKTLNYLYYSLFFIVGGIVLFNTVSHSPFLVYDHRYHTDAILSQSQITSILPQFLSGNLSYNPYFPYYLLGKIHALLTLFHTFEFHPYYWIRVVQSLGYIYLFYLFIERIFANKSTHFKIAAALLIFCIPNFYLSNVMVRSDHILNFLMMSLIYLWFFKGMKIKISYSNKWRIIWLTYIVLLANTRHIAVIVCGVFFIWGFYRLIKHSDLGHKQLLGYFFLITLLSTHFYGIRKLSSGYLFSMGTLNDYHKHYEKKRVGFSRKYFFTNMQFDKIYEKPNRSANHYLNNPDGTQDSFFPKLYSDMWGDYWLYFSGAEAKDNKIQFKRIAMFLGLPITIFLILGNLFQFVKYLISLNKREPTLFETCSILGIFGFILFILINYIHPEVGKNGFVKFTYYFPYFLPSVIASYGLLKNKVFKYYFIYLVVCFFCCMPLYIYTINKVF